MKCLNPKCGATLGCTCKIRKASDGQSCCSVCIGTYEASIKKGNAVPQQPTNVKVVYDGPGKQH